MSDNKLDTGYMKRLFRYFDTNKDQSMVRAWCRGAVWATAAAVMRVGAACCGAVWFGVSCRGCCLARRRGAVAARGL
jgi:hypothetical protein